MVRQKIDSLTSLRLFAAAAIVAYHARGHFGLSPDFLVPFELSQGVSFFFVLSGFILAFVYPDLEAAGATGKFFRARFARIWPLHLATLLLFVRLLPQFTHATPGALWAYLALVQGWIPKQSWFFSFNAVSWSLSTEAFFYFAFPFLIKDFAKTWAAKVCFCFAIIVILTAIANGLQLPVSAPDSVSIYGLMYINPLSRLLEFVLGMSAAHLYSKYLVGREAPLIVGLGVEISALASVYLLTFNTFSISNWMALLPYVGEAGRVWLVHCGLPVFSFASLIVAMAWGRGPISRILCLRPLVFLGEISFAAYLLHYLFLQYYITHFASEQGPWPLTLYVTILLVSSFIFWSLIEVPCRQLIVQGPKALVRPRLASVLASVLALSGLFALCFAIWSGASLERISENAPAIKGALSRGGNFAFGEELILRGTQCRPTKSGLHVTLYWQSLRRQKVKNYIEVKFLSADNVLVGSKSYRQSLREEVVKQDDCFKNEIFIPAGQLVNVQYLAFGLQHLTGESPPARLLKAGLAGAAERPKIYQGMVEVQLGPTTVACKQTKHAL